MSRIKIISALLNWNSPDEKFCNNFYGRIISFCVGGYADGLLLIFFLLVYLRVS